MRSALIISIVVILLWGCDSATAPDCLKSKGDIIVKTFELEPFSEVEVNEDFNVIIKQGPVQEVRLITGENLIETMIVEVNSGILVLTDNNSCKWVRDLDFPTVEITSPNLTAIRQNGGGKISSVGNLTYPQLLLFSEDSSGDFEMTVDCDQLVIGSNELSNFFIEGNAADLNVSFYSGDSRFEGRNLFSNDVKIFHRGSNDMVINASNSLRGVIEGKGDLIYVHQIPQIIEVDVTNRGKLINGTGE